MASMCLQPVVSDYLLSNFAMTPEIGVAVAVCGGGAVSGSHVNNGEGQMGALNIQARAFLSNGTCKEDPSSGGSCDGLECYS